MRFLIGIARLAAGIIGGAAVIVTFAASAAKSPINPFNFFGYFTIQANIIFLIVILMAAVDVLTNRRQSPALVFARAAATTYTIIVGIVYNTLLTGLEGGIAVPWANTVLHVVIPIYALADWLLFGDRRSLPWKSFWIVLIYPLIWLAVVLIRVGTDGMAFYPFLNYHRLGGGIVALYCVGIAIGFALFGLLVWAISRVHLLKPTSTGAPAA